MLKRNWFKLWNLGTILRRCRQRGIDLSNGSNPASVYENHPLFYVWAPRSVHAMYIMLLQLMWPYFIWVKYTFYLTKECSIHFVVIDMDSQHRLFLRSLLIMGWRHFSNHNRHAAVLFCTQFHTFVVVERYAAVVAQQYTLYSAVPFNAVNIRTSHSKCL